MLSIAAVARNSAPGALALIRQLQAHRNDEWRLVLVDDASLRENFYPIMQQISADERTGIIRHDLPEGYSKCMNRALSDLLGERSDTFVFIDTATLVATPNWVEVMMATLRQNWSADLLGLGECPLNWTQTRPQCFPAKETQTCDVVAPHVFAIRRPALEACRKDNIEFFSKACLSPETAVADISLRLRGEGYLCAWSPLALLESEPSEFAIDGKSTRAGEYQKIRERYSRLFST